MINNLNILFVIGIVLFILSCSSLSTKTEEFRSGRLKYIETLKYGPAGTHGSDGWYIDDREFKVNGIYWQPRKVKAKDISACEASPNERVEALKCEGFVNSKEEVYILRMKADNPEWVTGLSTPFDPANNSGEWIGGGNWLIFKDFYFNVETSERKEIKGLPDYPVDYFLAASPDLETIIYRETCFTARYDLPPDKPKDGEINKQCKLYDDHQAKGIAAFWLIQAKTGSVKILELKKEKYDWLDWKQEQFYSRNDWLKYFQQQLIWEKDKEGKDQLVSPK